MNEFVKRYQISITIMLFLLSTGFFSFKYIVQNINYSHFYGAFNIFLLLYLSREIIKRDSRKDVVGIIKRIIIMFVVAIIWATFFHAQSPINSIQGMAVDLPLVTFFFFLKYQFDHNQLVKAIYISGILYGLIYIYSLLSYPHNIFAFTNSDEIAEMIENTIEERGVIRLHLPGADIMITLFFLILTYHRRNKIGYLLLIPIVIIIVLRGTRTPLFISILVGCGYLLYKVKKKVIGFLLLIVVLIGSSKAYDSILEGKGTDPISRYVKLTHWQIQSNETEQDIRIEMSTFFFTKYNKNPLEYIVGNGKPAGSSDYSKELIQLSRTNSYYIDDVGFTYIFVYYGVIGLLLYTLLFIYILKTPVEEKYMFSKLYVIYGYLILPTNISILGIAPFIFSLNLYIAYRSSINIKKRMCLEG